MKRIVTIVLVAAVALTLINDIGNYIRTAYRVDELALETARVASQRNLTRSQNAAAAARYAAEHGATVFAFDQNETAVRAYLQMPVTGTWVTARLYGLLAGDSSENPLTVRADRGTALK